MSEMDDEIEQWKVCVRQRDVHIWKIDALRPDCPTCSGVGRLWTSLKIDIGPPLIGYGDCPDCTDGRMPFERMAAIVNAVFASHAITDFETIMDHLRGVTA